MLNCEKALLAMNDVPDAYIESARAMLGYRVGEQKRFSARKRIIAFALAAALVLSLGIAAYAVYVHWSRGMERKLPATGTEKQRAEESGLSDTSQTVSATANGVTISVEQTVIDGDTAEIALRIEGWKLDRAQELNAAIWGGFPTFDGESAPASGGSFVVERGADDCAHIIAADGSIEYDFWARAGDKLGTLSGREISITIESLGVSGKGGPYQPLVEGPWVLTWTPRSNSDRLTVRLDAPIGDTGLRLLSAEISPVSAKVSLKLDKLWVGYETLDDFDWQLTGVRLRDGTALTGIFGPPTEVGYTDIDALILEMDYSSNRILEPNEVDALIFAENSPWARTLEDSELIIVPLA